MVFKLRIQARSSKSYFDPNTGENLNYAVLMERCITDPDTGLLFLAVEVTDEAIKEKLNLVINFTRSLISISVC